MTFGRGRDEDPGGHRERRADRGETELQLPHSASGVAPRLDRLWRGHVSDFSWELDFWGKNRSALAAAVSDQHAGELRVRGDASDLVDLRGGRLCGASDLYTVRDNAADDLTAARGDGGFVSPSARIRAGDAASVRQVEARRASAEARTAGDDERIALQGNAIAALLGAGPDRGLAITRPTVALCRLHGIAAKPRRSICSGRRPDIVAARLRTEAAAHRIDEQKAGFYPSVNLLAFAGVQSLGIHNLVKPRIPGRLCRPGGVIADLQHAPAAGASCAAPTPNTMPPFATYNATLSQALREVADAATSRKALDGELAPHARRGRRRC